MADFPTTPKPDYPVEETPAAPEVLISTHKDGSEQRRYKGAGKGPTFRLSFGASLPISNAERLAILNHYDGQSGTTLAFNWHHPERMGETHLVRYTELPQIRHVCFNGYEATVSFQEVPA
jgi:hypothetical protein